MSRDLTAGYQSQLSGGSFRPVVFYEGAFASGTLRLWSGIASIAWNGQTWTGVGGLLGVSEVHESDEIRANGMTVSLSGVDPSRLSLVLGQARSGAAGRLWFGLLDGAGAVIADPYLAFEGRLDEPTIDEGGETATISISYESRLIDLERPRERRYTHEDQQIDFPGDLGFQYVAELQDKVVVW